MKLTKRGSDYLKACLITAAICSFLNIRMLVALSLVMMIAALISQLILASSSGRNIKVELQRSHLSVFKGDSTLEKVKIESKRRRFISVKVVSLKGPEGIESSYEESNSDDSFDIAFSFEPHYAGRFSGLTAELELRDPLQLFYKRTRIARPDFVIDSLPRSLIAEINVARPMSITLGERAGRTRGSGQEFYALDRYTTESEKRDIMWKTVARMPDDRLIVRIRESNIPRTMKIGVVRKAPRTPEEELKWMDIACEGVGMLGQIILLIGCDVELVYNADNRVQVDHAAGLTELSSMIMEMSSSKIVGGGDEESIASIVADADIVITGMKELLEEEEKQPFIAHAIARKPSLLVSELEEENIPESTGDLSVVFTGSEDLTRLVNRVVSK